MKQGHLTAFAMTLVVIVSSACGEETDVMQESMDLARSIAATGGPDHQGQTSSGVALASTCNLSWPDSIIDVRLVLDVSRSMAGYTGQAGEFTRFDETIDRLAASLGIAQIYAFGEPENPGLGLLEVNPLGPSIHEPSFFRRINNPDYCLFQAQAETSGVLLYFTDGVQSTDALAVASPSITALRSWVGEGRGLAILQFSSRFNGPAWSEQRKQWLGTVDVATRPFFVFALASSDQELDLLLDRIPPSLLRRAEVLRFPQYPVECEAALQGLFHRSMRDPTWTYLRGGVDWLVSSMARVDPALLKCQIAPGYPIEAVFAAMEAEYHRWAPGTRTFLDPEDLSTGTEFVADSVVLQRNASSLSLTGWIPADPISNYGFYSIWMHLEPGPIKDRIREISTPSDDDAETFDRIYRFDWMVDHLVRQQFADLSLHVPLFLTLRYR